jgi:hypothetical protein
MNKPKFGDALMFTKFIKHEEKYIIPFFPFQKVNGEWTQVFSIPFFKEEHRPIVKNLKMPLLLL